MEILYATAARRSLSLSFSNGRLTASRSVSAESLSDLNEIVTSRQSLMRRVDQCRALDTAVCGFVKVAGHSRCKLIVDIRTRGRVQPHCHYENDSVVRRMVVVHLRPNTLRVALIVVRTRAF